MRDAIGSAGLEPGDIDYINLHGTGTIDNDRSESIAVKSIFNDEVPLHSSVKGAFGHTLAAAGAIEAVVSVIALREGLVPANTGLARPDPSLPVRPVKDPIRNSIDAVLSNSFGFGGNNASLVISRAYDRTGTGPGTCGETLSIIGIACLTGAGNLESTVERLNKNGSCSGPVPLKEVTADLPPKKIRRLKRLTLMSLALSGSILDPEPVGDARSSIFLGTSLGALSETSDFLARLAETGEQFASPIDFVGSVHNAPAGQIAIFHGATGPNVTVTGGNYSFEQALLSASLLAGDGSYKAILGIDEYHPDLSPLFDASVQAGEPSDGGGALLVGPPGDDFSLTISLKYFQNSEGHESAVKGLVSALGGRESTGKYDLIMVGIPADSRETGDAQLEEFLSQSSYEGAVARYRDIIGEYGSSSATAAALAARFLAVGAIPGCFTGGDAIDVDKQGILIIGLGPFITAVEVLSG
jgi:3-oxoacyl-[acyl-carrier-protein] synthase-1/3-oxoacyl-[acyl-carrier-protein] synthase II